MSRTYRRKTGKQEDWFLEDHWNELADALAADGAEKITLSNAGCWCRTNYVVYYSRDSKIGKKKLAQYHSDAYTHGCREPGPMWALREFCQRPYRREAAREISKFLRDADYEVVLRSKPRHGYWT